MNDSAAPVPHPPYEDLRAAAGDNEAALAHLDALYDELHRDKPDAGKVGEHATALRGIENTEARVANWWDDINTQRWVMELGNMGL